MPFTRVIKLDVADTNGDVALIHVSAKKPDDFNLDLLATDGEFAFRGKVRERNFVKLKAPNYDGSDDEWKSILKQTFGLEQADALGSASTQNLEVSCSKSGKPPKTTLTINFRSRIEEITQRMGVVELPQTPEIDDINCFDWASQLTDERDNSDSALRQEKVAAATAHQLITSLEAQLAELIEVKAEHEDDMMAKFVQLLNEKKMELRKRARQLSTAKMDPKRLEQLEEEQGPTSEQPEGRGRKRPAEEIPEDYESEGFEDRMDFDNDEEDEERARHRSRSTTRASDSDPDDSDDLDGPVTYEKVSTGAAPPKIHSKPLEPEPMPPRRDLPFTRKAKDQHKQSSSKAVEPEDDETASEDDEL